MQVHARQSDRGESPCEVCPTRTVCLAAQVEPEQRLILPGLFHVLGPMQEDSHLYRAGDVVDGQYHVRSGFFKTYNINAEGDEYVTGFYLPGDVLGHVHRQGRHAESAIALEHASVCELNAESLERGAVSGLTTLLINQHAEQANLQVLHQLNLKQTSAQARFAGFCVLFAERLHRLGRCPNHLPTPMSRTDIASYLGMTLESLSRVISKLNAAEVVCATRDHIEVLQPDTLNTLGLHVAQ